MVLQQAELLASWEGGPVSAEFSWNGTAVGPEDIPLALSGRVWGDRLGLRIEDLTAATVVAPMLTVEGRVPVYLEPGGVNGWVQFHPERPIDLRATTEATGLITLAAGEAGEVYLWDPSVEFHLRGTVAQPEGRVRGELNRMEWRTAGGALAAPPVDRVLIDALLQREQLRLERFEVEVDGQPVRVTGEWPLEAEDWIRLMAEGRLPRWQEATAEIRIEDARVGPFARYLPEVLSPQGRLDLSLVLLPGARFEGDLSIVNAATRPIGPLTPIRDIEVRIHLDGRQATIERFRGQMGGQPVAVTGGVELTELGLPIFDLEVSGRNVPVVRRPGFLLRSDLDLRLESAPDQPTRLSGHVGLRDGLFIQDTASLVTGRLERPPTRPPYFSVTNAPFDRWQLDVRVSGDRFLRVRTPVFIGMISGNGRVRGSLREPLVTGDARIHSGRFLFPFGTLPVDQGYASLGENDPRGPSLTVLATGRNFRYHVRLEIEGTAEEPLIQFSSTPPLTSEEILLMLTAGELPQREIVYSTEARAGRLATYLGREMVTRFVGDETAEERLIINSGENIAEDGKTTYSIEYRLHPRWSVVGEYDRFNALNAGFKWRLFRR
jgi:translocation and assembly module TamB